MFNNVSTAQLIGAIIGGLLVTFVVNRLIAWPTLKLLGHKATAALTFILGMCLTFWLSRFDFNSMLMVYGSCWAFWLLIDLNRPFGTKKKKVPAAEYEAFMQHRREQEKINERR